MIKARGEANGEPLILLGLSQENITRLTAGKPIRFDGREVGLSKSTVVICYGKTEDAIKAELSEYFDIRDGG